MTHLISLASFRGWNFKFIIQMAWKAIPESLMLNRENGLRMGISVFRSANDEGRVSKGSVLGMATNIPISFIDKDSFSNTTVFKQQKCLKKGLLILKHRDKLHPDSHLTLCPSL
jgi:hypothetical protein